MSEIVYDQDGIQLWHGDVLDCLREMEPESVNTCVTSPPYWGLRDYGCEPQNWPEVTFTPISGTPKMVIPAQSDCLGLEADPWAFIGHLVAVFREVRRVLRDDGTAWLNVGDSYASNGTGGNGATGGRDKSTLSSQMPPIGTTPVKKKVPEGLKVKDLIGIPWLLAFALRADGWYLRKDIIWNKPNPMPSSAKDRPTSSHEHILLLSKLPRYYYDYEAIKEDAAPSSIARWNQNIEEQRGSDRVPGKTNGAMKAVGGSRSKRDSFKREGSKRESPIINQHSGTHRSDREESEWDTEKRNKRDVWTVSTKPFKEAHFATFNPELITPCILAGCPEGGTVLDPFMGSGTTAVTAHHLGRKAIGCELNGEYLHDICIPRVKQATKQQRLIA